jgi:AAHS family 3-hydroxyphenylpropionic acid transporter
MTALASPLDSPASGRPVLLLFCATAALGLAVGAAIGGRIADHLGRTRSLGGSLLLFGVFSLLTAATRNVESLFAARLLTGLGLGAAMPNFISLASESAPSRHRLAASTLVMAAMLMGGVTAGLVALGAAWGWNWRTIFLAGGLASLLPAIVLWRWPSERGTAPGARAQVDSVATVLLGGERAVTTALLWIGFFFTQLVLLLTLNWLPSLMIGIGFSRTQASLASICFILSGSLGAIVLGRLHAGRRRRLWVITTYTGMAVALTAVGAVGKVFSVAALACAFAGLFIIGAQLSLFALALAGRRQCVS